MLYNYDFDIVGFVMSVIAVIFILWKKKLERPVNKAIFVLAIFSALTCFFDILTCFPNSYPDQYSKGLRDFSNYGYLICQNLMPFIFFVYILFQTGVDKTFTTRASRIKVFSLTIPVVIVLLCFLLNPFFNWVFYYDSAGMYTHGPAFYVLYAVDLLYLVLSTVYLFKYGRGLTYSKKLMGFFFIFSSIVAEAVQAFIPDILISCFIETIVMMGILLVMDNWEEISDFTTGCYNKRAFIEDNRNYFINRSSYSMATVDITNYENANLKLGIDRMTGIMALVGEFLRNIRKEITVYYLDKGYFVLLSTHMDNIEDAIRQAEERFSNEWVEKTVSCKLDTVISTIKVPEEINNLEHLLLVIDNVRENYSESSNDNGYQNKGKITTLIERFNRQSAVEDALYKAILDNGFEVYYQPIWDTEAKAVSTAEALLRLKDPDLGFIPPDEFIPIAEKKGRIIEIGKIVLRNVLDMMNNSEILQHGFKCMEVNLSMIQCMNSTAIKDLLEMIEKSGIDTSHINFEITESQMSMDSKALRKSINSIKKAGCGFSMDDYGTGYSNLSYFFDIPFDLVKIDRSIMWKSREVRNAYVILDNTIRMAHELGIKVVTEGVETPEQMAMLEEMNCDYLQGFYFSTPVPSDEFIAFVKKVNDKQ
jgi:EAL domain-containing protein (putative c-di-GMP-specific phosphodiesterase class I)